ncbi:PREDICTED: uncharacterized protein LOC104811704 [Tarenaya hassleriana]|uniref:uncharacterized protein LOC104811704 n=1 Tax=Tarenaya hassleriana TaxID=28532 RepID=UPI00053C1EF4|nr:PREDICTED: uncharacterized protein LOC104811704 [Tarenaya hassleriana]XP_010536797.1 PREDICTED: uncharacterized protein LOC104811704 [Tarenaya hassleriana]
MFLSTENHPPNDPSSSSSFLHLTSSCDELGQSHHNNLHLPNFSIRDYVCSYRSKDIKKNWPFAPKSLQLCLRHGINDPLPPFQPPGAVGNHPGNILASEACSLEKQIIPSGEPIIPSCLSDKSKLDNIGSNQTLKETRKGVENDFLPTVSFLKSEIKVPIDKNPVKKCGLLPKSGACLNRGSKEDNFLATPESMASKTCPICKTFSSASNTTLNAHIDQCLSADSALPPAKPSRQRIKPRRVRTMTDIYATAKGCTLEELDKRNGTMWTMISRYSNWVADKPEVSKKGKKRKVFPAPLDGEAVGVGPVYVDGKGKKLRILSEFRENSPMLREHKGVSLKKKSLKEGKGGKWCSTRKKVCRGKKHHKYLRLIPRSRKLISQKANASKIPEYQEGYSGEGSGMERAKSRILNQRLLSKRTGMSRKLNMRGHKFHPSQDEPFENEDWSGDPMLSRSPTHKLTAVSDSVSSPLNKEKIWRTYEETPVIRKSGTSFRRKSAQSPSSRVRITENKEWSLAEKVVSTDGARYLEESPHASRARKNSSASVDKVSVSEAKPFRKLKKARFHLLEKEDDELEKWEFEAAQDRALMDDDSDSGKTDDVLMSLNATVSSDDNYDDDDESSEEDAANSEEDDALDKTDGADTEFYQSDTPPSIEICNGGISQGDEGQLYCSEEVGDMVYGQTARDMGSEPDSRVGQGSSFMEVDPIPIPGPPGSFLPSPRDMGSDDYPGNSSVITSQVQSSLDQLDLTDRISSESPLSAVSTHSDSAVVRSSHPNLPPEFSTSQEMISSDYPSSYKKRSFLFRSNDQPCCCQGKERFPEGFTVNHQEESQPLKQRAAASPITIPETRTRSCLDPNITLSKSDTFLDTFEPYIFQDSDLQSKFMNRAATATTTTTTTTSPPNPVLRLMGKDLMVVNQGEEAPTPSSKPTPQFLDPSGTYESSLQTFHHETPHHYNSSLYFGNNASSAATPQTTTAEAYSFGLVRYFSPS